MNTSLRKKSLPGDSSINPEIFYMIFSLYDAKNMQKISANFYWIPNHDLFLKQFDKYSSIKKTNTSLPINSMENIQLSTSKASHIDLNKQGSILNLFSMDGKNIITNPVIHLHFNSEIKPSILNRINKALYNIQEVHDEIYLVVRIEKMLDGCNLHSSMQPYLMQMNETSKIKAAIKLNRKMNQLMKTRLVNYKQPFAWAAKYEFNNPFY